MDGLKDTESVLQKAEDSLPKPKDDDVLTIDTACLTGSINMGGWYTNMTHIAISGVTVDPNASTVTCTFPMGT